MQVGRVNYHAHATYHHLTVQQREQDLIEHVDREKERVCVCLSERESEKEREKQKEREK